jgi:phosphatidylglycerophosphate synthase
VIEERFVILVDESANWKIAGLRQLDRLQLALRESAGTTAKLWESGSDSPDAGRVLSTHLFVHRKALAEFLAAAPTLKAESDSSWSQFFETFKNSCPVGGHWRYLASPNEIPLAEKELLRQTGKPQDGVVSRFINRPLTRALTRFLLKFPITPTGWTLGIFSLPILTAIFLVRGSYFSIVIGTAIYQLYSMLDGCDGEIARAKYLESKSGGRIDDFCDILGALLFVSALGVGLGGIYAAEGFTLAALIALNEWLLHLPQPVLPNDVSAAAYPRHRRLLESAGASPLRRKIAWCVLQATKRDVGILLFLLLALVGLPQWTLHPWLLVTLTTLVLNLVSRGRRTRP